MTKNLRVLEFVLRVMENAERRAKECSAGAGALLERLREKLQEAKQSGTPVPHNVVEDWLRAIAANQAAANDATTDLNDARSALIALLSVSSD